MSEVDKAIIKIAKESYLEKDPNANKYNDFLMYLYWLKENDLHLECGFGCEFYGYTCGGNPMLNPHCSYSTLVNAKGEEVCVE